MELPEPDPEPAAFEDGEVIYLGVPQAQQPRADDGELHARGKDVVFAGAPRGPVESPAERRRLDRDLLLGAEGLQLMGAVALTIMCWAIVVRGVLSLDGVGSAVKVGSFAVLGVYVPLVMRAIRQVQSEGMFFGYWAASRGYVRGAADGPDSILPGMLSRSPLLGQPEGRVIERVARRVVLERRESIVGVLRRVLAPEPQDEDDPADTAPDTCRFAFAVMTLPDVAAARWSGASIRADHLAARPLHLRAMIGPLMQTAVPECRAHLAAAPDQEPGMPWRLLDERLERYLAEHPMDVDIVGNLLVVTRDGDPYCAEHLDELARDALVLHELLVAHHELPEPAVEQVEVEEQTVLDEPVIDRTREGWGEGDAQVYEAA